jgi:hypothetical protein
VRLSRDHCGGGEVPGAAQGEGKVVARHEGVARCGPGFQEARRGVVVRHRGHGVVGQIGGVAALDQRPSLPGAVAGQAVVPDRLVEKRSRLLKSSLVEPERGLEARQLGVAPVSARSASGTSSPRKRVNVRYKPQPASSRTRSRPAPSTPPR